MRAIATGMIASHPVGGVARDYGHYAPGLERLGFEVYYLEVKGTETYDPALKCCGEDRSYGVGFLADSLPGPDPGRPGARCRQSPRGRGRTVN